MASGIAGESATLQRLDRLEAQMERRLAEVELRNQRYWDSLEASLTSDQQSLSALKALAVELEIGMKGLTTWRSSIGERSELLDGAKAMVGADLQQLSLELGNLRDEHQKAQGQLSTGAREELVELDRKKNDELERWKRGLQEAVDDLRGSFTEDWKCSVSERLDWNERRLEDQKDDLVALRELWSGAQEEDRFAAREEELREVFSKFEARLLSLENDLPTKVRSELASGLQDLLMERVTGEVQAQLGPAVGKALETTAREEIAQLHAERSAMRRAWERVEGLRHDSSWGYFLKQDDDWRKQVQARLDELAEKQQKQRQEQEQEALQQQSKDCQLEGELPKTSKSEVSGSEVSKISQKSAEGSTSGSGSEEVTELKSVWIEIGRLGCRLAETHQMLDAVSYRMESHFAGVSKTDIRCLPGGKSEVIKAADDMLTHPVLKIKDQSNQEKSQGAAAAAVRRRRDATSASAPASASTPKAVEAESSNLKSSPLQGSREGAKSSCPDSADCAAGGGTSTDLWEGRREDGFSGDCQQRPSFGRAPDPHSLSFGCTTTGTSMPMPESNSGLEWHSSSLPTSTLTAPHTPWAVVPNPSEFVSKDWSGMLAAGLHELEIDDRLNDSDG